MNRYGQISVLIEDKISADKGPDLYFLMNEYDHIVWSQSTLTYKGGHILFKIGLIAHNKDLIKEFRNKLKDLSKHD